MKKHLFLAVLAAATVLSGCKGAEKTENTPEQTQTQSQAQTEAEESSKAGWDGEKPQVKIYVKDYGTITVELEPEAAPVTVENFVSLAKDGFYDGLTFHRIMSGFMIQGGDPLGTGIGGSDRNIKGEFTKNGVDNPLSHTRGAISMARSRDMDSASSQFFIVHEDSVFLDGEYAAFGYVTEGMDVVDKICESVKAEDNNGTVKKENQPVIEKIEVVE
ncbi:peptidylprolyl isomerase [Clostridium sp. MCC353]|uniref:peptidylprolyl isomerase n=1 Tax=Clostridium sp. MCC353 TaxID=2592646 RepID=UPI001C00AD4C|nr:peptidylprolyl isomerase [Clostridium sp. MCC353]MBT9775600.1 peptidylprolyl isomerase [Clostridium sp. MCC353]